MNRYTCFTATALALAFAGAASASTPSLAEVRALATTPETTLEVTEDGTFCIVKGALFNVTENRGVGSAPVQLVPVPYLEGITGRSVTDSNGVYVARILMPADVDNVVLREKFNHTRTGSIIRPRYTTVYTACGNASVSVGEITNS